MSHISRFIRWAPRTFGTCAGCKISWGKAWYCSSVINTISSHRESGFDSRARHCTYFAFSSILAACTVKSNWMNIPLLLKKLSSVNIWARPLAAMLYFSLLKIHFVGEWSSLLARHSLTAQKETVKFSFIISCGRRTVHCQTQTSIWIKLVNILVSAGEKTFMCTTRPFFSIIPLKQVHIWKLNLIDEMESMLVIIRPHYAYFF